MQCGLGGAPDHRRKLISADCAASVIDFWNCPADPDGQLNCPNMPQSDFNRDPFIRDSSEIKKEIPSFDEEQASFCLGVAGLLRVSSPCSNALAWAVSVRIYLAGLRLTCSVVWLSST